jgi:hypothetical protein
MSPSTPEQNALPSDRRVLVGALFRKHRKRVTLREAPPPAPVRRPAHMARLLALAHHLQSAIDRGLVPDRAEVVRRLGLTRARVTQFLDLLLLAPDLQDQVLHLEAVDGEEPPNSRPSALQNRAHSSYPPHASINKPARQHEFSFRHSVRVQCFPLTSLWSQPFRTS